MAEIIKFANDRATGIATPRYTTQKVAQNLNPDLFIDMLDRHPEHIARSKAKRERILEENRRKKMAASARKHRLQSQMVFLGYLSAISALVATIAVWMLL